MKHLLIILSILLLSSPVIGDNHKGETLYLWETSSGEVWKGFGEKGTHPKYKGDVKNGKPNGVGILIHPNGDKYVGEWKDGNPWEGVQYSASGKVQGTYSNGEPCGGCEPTARQLVLVREIDPSHISAALPPCPSSGVFHNCFGTFTYDDGDKYVGEWKENQMHGHGTYTWANGDKYIGEFRDGRNTYGVQYSALGRLQGTFSNGEWCEACEPNANQLALVREIDPSHLSVLPPCPTSGYFDNCFGSYTDADGNKYVGEWKDDKRHGQGTSFWADGDQHVGEYKDGEEHGHGTYTWADGDVYVGEFKDGEEHGHGTYTWTDGDMYAVSYTHLTLPTKA